MAWKRVNQNRVRANRPKKRWIQQKEDREGKMKPSVTKPKKRTDQELFAEDKTNSIRRFVLENTKNHPFEVALLQLFNTINHFKRVPIEYRALQRIWGNRPAAQIIREKTLFTIGKIRLKNKLPIQGCMDAAIALIATCRMLAQIKGVRVQVFFVRKKGHSYVRVKYNNKDILLDLFNEARPIDLKKAAEIRKNKQLGVWKEGFGPRDIDINGINNFY